MSNTNKVYFSDGYGLKAIETIEFVGESQNAVQTVFAVPDIPSNDVTWVSGNRLDDYDSYDFLVMCFAEGEKAGAVLVANENIGTKKVFRDGYDVDKATITNEGTMYLINKDLNQLEVFYGIHSRPGSRPPDYVYNTTSTPALFDGYMTELHIAQDYSLIQKDGNRIYVGTTLGMSILDAYDLSNNGFSPGLENTGTVRTFSISTGGAQFKVIGGTVPRVNSIFSDDEKLIVFVATNDGAGNGGVTQINLSGNRRILFITKDSGLIPSNDIRDIYRRVTETI